MSSCCSSSGCDSAQPHKGRCPVNGLVYSEVTVRTIAHHIQEPWSWVPSAKHYYFCDAPDCDVAYFGDDNSVVLKTRLRHRVGVKERAEQDLLCYCFGVSRADFERDPATKEFVIAQTKIGACSCETSNPSGRCCLKDFSTPS
ncbi:MAG: hypothetical protein WAT23_09730 [Chromatiaceae bacterium]